MAAVRMLLAVLSVALLALSSAQWVDDDAVPEDLPQDPGMPQEEEGSQQPRIRDLVEDYAGPLGIVPRKLANEVNGELAKEVLQKVQFKSQRDPKGKRDKKRTNGRKGFDGQAVQGGQERAGGKQDRLRRLDRQDGQLKQILQGLQGVRSNKDNQRAQRGRGGQGGQFSRSPDDQ